MADPSEQVGTRTTGFHDLPSNEISSWAEEHDDLPITGHGLL
jgi:hypothetical protein